MGSLPHETEPLNSDLYVSLGFLESKKGAPGFPRVLSLLSSLLERAVHKSERLLDSVETQNALTIFHGPRAPNLAIQSYIERIFKYSKCSPSCFVLAHVYIERHLKQADVLLTSLNVHRLLITSVVIAAKFIDDAFYNNAYYARVGGVSTREMNDLEINLLFSLDFRLQVNLVTFERHCLQLEEEAALFIIERPLQFCGRKNWTKIEESRCEPTLQRCSCGAV